jgi:hypothetical protein
MNKVCEISSFIDIIIDDYVVTRKKPKASFIKFLQAESIDRRTINNFVENKTNYLEEQIKELELAMSGLDPQVKEGYGNFRKPELREFKEMLEQIIDDLYSYKDSKKIIRKHRNQSPQKIVKYIKLIDSDYELDGVTYKSLSPTEIIGAKHVFLYNIENRELSYYTGRSLNVKRTMVTGFDVDKSWVRKLRKPEEFLSEVISCTKYNIENISSHLTTKPKQPTGRTNAKQILIKVIK